MSTRYLSWGLLVCVALGFGIAVGVVRGAGEEDKATGVSEEAYSGLMTNEVLDVQDLAEGAEIQRRFFNSITPPGVDLFQPMFPPVAPFVSTNFADAFLDGLLGEDKNSVAIYPLSLVLDPKTRETLVYNAEGGLIATVPADKTSRSWPEDADPARVTLQLDLLPTEDMEPYLYVEDRVEESLASVASKSAKTPRAGGVVMMSLGTNQFGILDFQRLTNGNMQLTVTNGSDVAEVFSYTVVHTSALVVVGWTNELGSNSPNNILWGPTSAPFNGLESDWQCRETNLTLTGGVGVWEDSDISTNDRVRFYGVAKKADADADGLTDGAELFTYHSEPTMADTDGDGLTDLEEVQLGTDLNASNVVQNVYFVDELPEAPMRRSATESDMYVTWSNLQAKAMYTARYKDGYGEFTSGNLPASVPPKIYLTKERSYQSECHGTIYNPYGEDGTMDFELYQTNYCRKAFDPLGWPSTPTNHVCAGYSDFSRIYNSTSCYYMIEAAWDFSYGQPALSLPVTWTWQEWHSTCPPYYNATNKFTDYIDTCDFLYDWYGSECLVGDIFPVSHTRSYISRTGDHFLNCDSYSSPPFEMYEEVLTGEYTDTMLWDYTDADLQVMMTNWSGLAWGYKLVRSNHTYPLSTNILSTSDIHASRYVYTNYNRIELQALRFRWEIPTDTGVVYKIYWQEDFWPEDNWLWSCSTEWKECHVQGTGSTAYSTNFDILPPGSNGYIQLAPASRMVLEIYQPRLMDPDETMIPEEDKLTKGGVTFVNLDNDDHDALFDYGEASEDGDVDGGDDELVKIKLKVQTSSWAPSTARLIATAGATNIAVWTSSNKLASSAYALGTDLDLWSDFAYESNWFVKTMWVEGISAQTVQQGTKLKMEYVVGSITNKDEVALTVAGVDHISWRGRGNSLSDGDTLDADVNWPGGLSPNSWRVFPDARVVGGSVETNARDKVNVEVGLTVEPPSEIKLYLKSFDVDDPTASSNAVDGEATAEDNRGDVSGEKSGKITGEDASGILELVFPENVKTTNCEFQTTMQPGDNFRIVANGDRDFFSTLVNNDAAQGGTGTEAEKNANKQRIVCTNVTGTIAEQEIRLAGHYASDVLTVWRFLHVEVDSMAAPPATGAEKNTVVGYIMEISGNGTVAQRVDLDFNLVTGFAPQDNSDNLAATGNGRFENGWIKIGSGSGTPGEAQTSDLLGNGDDYVRKDAGIDIPVLVSQTGQPDVSGKAVAWSGTSFTLNISTGTLSTNYIGGTLNVAGISAVVSAISTNGGVNTVMVTSAQMIPFVLCDDDDVANTTWGLPRDPNTGFMANTDDIVSNKLKPAYIRPQHDGGGSTAWNTHAVPFIRNTENPSVYEWDSRGNNSTRFWDAYVLGSFQDSYNSMTYDRDGNGESATGGSTAPVGGSLIYLEQLRERYPTATDQDDLEERIVIHEVGHALTLDHGDGTDNPINNGIMNSSLQYAPTTQMRFIDTHLNTLRSLNRPNN